MTLTGYNIPDMIRSRINNTLAQFIYFVAISGIAVNYVLFNSIVLNSVLNDMVNDMSVLTAK